MHAALERVLGDEALRARVAAAGEQVRARRGLRRAADLIESLVERP
jgi:UDP:flavonoid glycosyltransferase YjiC (YdhE family)